YHNSINRTRVLVLVNHYLHPLSAHLLDCRTVCLRELIVRRQQGSVNVNDEQTRFGISHIGDEVWGKLTHGSSPIKSSTSCIAPLPPGHFMLVAYLACLTV